MDIKRVIKMLEEYREVMRAPLLAEQGKLLTTWAQSIQVTEVAELILVVRLLEQAQRAQLETLEEVFALAIDEAQRMQQ